MMRRILGQPVCVIFTVVVAIAAVMQVPTPRPVAAAPTPATPAPNRISVQPASVAQEFQGMGCGVQFYEGHVTSLAARHKDERQRQLYDDMFAKVPTRYLHLMIRPDHEPAANGSDPWNPTFDPKDFAYCQHTLAIAKAAKDRRPDIELLASLQTPPAWMKTNNAVGGGGPAKATLKPGMELKFAAFVWGFLAHMARGGAPVKYLAIANECDWPHDQPGCFFTPDAYAALFATVGDYLEKMATKFPDVPRAILVGPNTLSAPAAAKSYLPAMERRAAKYVQVLAAHDYDPRGDRWGDLRRLARGRPVWMTEWCARDKDDTAGQIRNATEYARNMHDVFTGGANVWMAYDWVYPPRNTGEALIHVDWGNDYTLTKPYWVFRQWATPLTPGMHVVQATAAEPVPAGNRTARPAAAAPNAGAPLAAPGILPTAFLAKDGKSLVVHVVNVADADAPIALEIKGVAHLNPAARHRTSATEDMKELTRLAPADGGYMDALPRRSLTSYRVELK